MLSRSKLILFGAWVSMVAAGTSPATAGDRCEMNGTDTVDGTAGDDTLLCGTGANGPGDRGTAIGVQSQTAIDNGVAVGFGSTAVNIPSTSGDYSSSSYFDEGLGITGTTAVGMLATSIGSNSTALGNRALVGSIIESPFGPGLTINPIQNGTAVGSYAGVQASGGTAVGSQSSVSGSGGTALGYLSQAIGVSSSAIGNSAIAFSQFSIATGYFSLANGIGAIALGAQANAQMGVGPAYSFDVPAPGMAAPIAIGQASHAFGADNLAIGSFAVIGNHGESTTTYQGATAVGAATHVTADHATTLGARTTATADNSVAIGYGSIADQASTVSVGSVGNERRVTNVAAGVNGTDAVNVSQLKSVTGDIGAVVDDVAANSTAIAANSAAIATHTTAIASLQSGMSAIEAAQDLTNGRIDSLFDLRHHDRRDMKEGVAAAMSMSNAPMPSEPGRVSYAVNGAMFRGEYAVGGSLQYRLNTQAPMAVNAGFSFAGNKNNGVRVGVAGEF